jgi:hypothetical protein
MPRVTPPRQAIVPEDLDSAADFVVATLKPGIGLDWDVRRAGSLDWSVRKTLIHAASTCVFYATHLAGSATHELPVTLASVDHPPNEQLLDVLAASPRVLSGLARSVLPDRRAFHAHGMADVEGWLAMGCVEVLVHGHDAALGLDLGMELPPELCEKVARRLFPWAPLDVPGATALLWANGRVQLFDDDLDEPSPWHCAPLAEWDGNRPRMERLPEHRPI